MSFEANVRKVVPYVPGEQPNRPNMIKLNTNECPYPPALGVEQALKTLNAEEMRLYPDPTANGLIEAIGEAYGMPKDQVFVGVGSDDVLAGVAFQREIERAAYVAGGGGYRAPAQLVGDFIKGRASAAFGEVVPSYLPGVTPADLRACLPQAVTDSLAAGLPLLGRQINGFDRYDAVMTGVESRSSSPVRILRDETGCSAVEGIYPCGEGAGYAGGIVSAAVDGVRIAECILARK